MTVQTSAQEFLATLVQCERHVGLFPSGMPVRACLRRQAERQRGTKGALGPPTKPYCAGQCEQGIEIATLAASVGVTAKACAGCGGALVGVTACEACAAAAMEGRKAGPATGFLPKGQEQSTRIWNGEAPDVPIGGPSGSRTERPSLPSDFGTVQTRRAPADRAREVAARVREAAPRVAPATVVNQQPAQPAEEETMRAARKPKECCGSKGPRHMAGCAEAGKTSGGKPALPPKPEKAAEKPRRVVAAAPRRGGRDLDLLALDELLGLRDEVISEIRRRKNAAEKALEELNTALGEAA